MNTVVNKKMKLFVLALIVLIMLCLLFINHYNSRVFIKVDNSIKDVFISDIPTTNEEIIVDNSINKVNINNSFENALFSIKINGQYKEKYLVSTSDIVEVEVSNIEKYKLYYSLKNDEYVSDYKIFDNNFLNNIDTPTKFNLYIKIVSGNKSREINVGVFSVYDIVYEHDVSKEIVEDIGTIYNDDGSIYVNEDNSEYLYDDVDINKNIVIDNVDIEKTIVTLDEEENEVGLNGNIYVVEETDLNEFDIQGHIYIDTEENITMNEDILIDSNIYSITVKSNNFTINDENYHYETIEEKIIISNSLGNEVNVTDIINHSKTELNEEDELVIIKDEVNSSFSLN